MPLNQQKVISIILDECKFVEERCNGYKDELHETLVEILTAERQHRVQGTHIQKKITDKCHATGEFLAQGRAKMMKENSQ